ncbi:MAG: hypothetical protein PGN15_03815 [Aeromicrobium erythreum]
MIFRNYDGLDLLFRNNRPQSRISVLIVDNTEPELARADYLDRWSERPDVDVAGSGINHGYSGAADFALKTNENAAKADFVILANTDLLFDFSELLSGIDELSRTHDVATVGSVAPQLVSADGESTRQLHYLKPPTAEELARTALVYRSYRLASIHRRLADAKRRLRGGSAQQIPTRIFAPHGAMIVVTRAYLQKTRGFDFPQFLFCEEHFVGFECADAGLSCVYAENLKYSHVNHGSMGSKPSRLLVGYLREAHEYAAERAAAAAR